MTIVAGSIVLFLWLECWNAQPLKTWGKWNLEDTTQLTQNHCPVNGRSCVSSYSWTICVFEFSGYWIVSANGLYAFFSCCRFLTIQKIVHTYILFKIYKFAGLLQFNNRVLIFRVKLKFITKSRNSLVIQCFLPQEGLALYLQITNAPAQCAVSRGWRGKFLNPGHCLLTSFSLFVYSLVFM